MNSIQLGEYIKELRLKNKLSYGELHELSSVSRSYISNIEKGRKGMPSARILSDLAPHLGVTKDHLLEKAGYIETKQVKINSNNQKTKIHLDNILKNRDNELYYGGVKINDDERKRFIAILHMTILPAWLETFTPLKDEISLTEHEIKKDDSFNKEDD